MKGEWIFWVFISVALVGVVIALVGTGYSIGQRDLCADFGGVMLRGGICAEVQELRP